ncbi:MAG: pglF [Candidatus Aminicenantes bacterium]|nr:pglF [Candidatus Aminicenantes bacterium]
MTLLRKLLFKRTSQVLIDFAIFGFSWVAAYFIRFEGPPPGTYLRQMLILGLCVIVARTLLFYVFSVYTMVWRYISIRDAFHLVRALVPLTLGMLLARYLAPEALRILRVPTSIIVIELLLVVLGTSGVRMVRRLTAESEDRETLAGKNGSHRGRNVLLIGAGDAGNLVLKELKQRSDLGIMVVGFVDDEPEKLKKNIQGVRVLGSTGNIPEIAKEYSVEEAIITIANASSKDIRRIVGICQEAGVKVKIVPGLFEMLDEKVTITKVREINIDDLLGRSIFQLEKHLPEVSGYYRGKTILVTGAGGSIGSELCRQLMAMAPREIVLLDKDENSIYEIDNDLRSASGNGIKVHPVVANVKNGERLKQIFAQYKPGIVFHAAAHKHVPLMELNVSEAILNNVLGTINVVETAAESGVERFIFISTDKAVNPTSVMGATKKLGEIIVQVCARRSGTKFSCVRFGNVLASRGSVVPLFQKQIAKGGPVTVTHPGMRRYFMSIGEAVHLIIQAGTLGEKGEIFVLDMGQAINIVDMVKTLIRLSGHREDDIEIMFTGVRPGEKLREEILIDEERTRSTKFEKIFIAPPVESLTGKVTDRVAEIVDAAAAGDDDGITVEHVHFQVRPSSRRDSACGGFSGGVSWRTRGHLRKSRDLEGLGTPKEIERNALALRAVPDPALARHFERGRRL